MTQFWKTITACLMLVFMAPAFAEGNGQTAPAKAMHKNVILTVKAMKSTDFNLADLQTLPQSTLKTTTPWTEGAHVYEGVLLRDLLKHLGLESAKEISAVALNDYATTLNVSDALKYDVLLALSEDGKLLSRRNKGPIWVVYPLSDHPELDKPTYHSAMIWQLRSLIVK